MTEHKWQHYLNTLVACMHMEQWEITIESEPCNDGHMAEIQCTDGRCRARIGLNRDFDTYTPDEQRATLVHELLHALTDLSMRCAEDDLGAQVLPQTRDMFVRTYRRLYEVEMDQIANILAPFMPLPTP
jgi:hypothetical protein